MDIKIKLGYKCSHIELPVAFIDNYMADCLPVYPLIYIWSFRRVLDGETATLQDISERFRITEGDVIKAWRHWEKERLVSISSEKEGMEIIFLPMPAPVAAIAFPMPDVASDTAPTAKQGFDTALKLGILVNDDVVPQASPANNDATPKAQGNAMASPRPQYTSQELACYREDSRDVERLFSRAEKTLGKLLTYNDMNVIFGFYDWLRLPIEVIEYLLTYCEENEHRNLRYIEKCAMDWADHNINDLEDALTYVQNFNRDYREILHHMGQSGGYPTPAQRKYMNKWLHEWTFSIAIITEACTRCVEQIAKPNFKYVDKILAEWHKKGVKTIEDITAADEEFVLELKKNTIRTAAKPKPNRFVNFNQRENDYERYEKMERAYLEQKYKV